MNDVNTQISRASLQMIGLEAWHLELRLTRFHAPKIGHWIYYIIHVCIGDWDCVGGLWQLNVASVFWSQFGVSMCFPCVYNAKSLPNLGKLVLFSSLHLLEILFLLPKDFDDSSACAGCVTCAAASQRSQRALPCVWYRREQSWEMFASRRCWRTGIQMIQGPLDHWTIQLFAEMKQMWCKDVMSDATNWFNWC